MIKRVQAVLGTKVGSAIGVVALVAAVGGVATVSAASQNSHQPGDIGYAFDQCKNGGWMNFKNPDGSPMFKNQGQCIAFFIHGGQQPGSMSDDHSTTNNVSVDGSIKQDVHSGETHSPNTTTGDVNADASTSTSITIGH